MPTHDCSSVPVAANATHGLENATAVALAHRSTALLVHSRGELWLEAYWRGSNASTCHSIASVSKSMVSALVGICIQRGSIQGIEQSVADFLPEWRGTEKGAISIRHLLSMTSGLRNPPLWQLLLERGTALTIGLELVCSPGSHWDYNTAAYCVLLTVIERAEGRPLEELSREALFLPLGMNLAHWCAWTLERKHPLSIMCSARELLAFGQLLLQRGCWNGQQLVGAQYVDQMLTPSGPLNRSYGHLIWLNQGERRLAPRAPHDVAMAMGARDTRLYVIPSRKMVVVRLGRWVQAPRDRYPRKLQREGSFDDLLLQAVCAASDGHVEQQATGEVGVD